MGKPSALPPNVSEFRDRHGHWRLRYRKTGQPTHYFQHKPGTPEFRAELEACRAAAPPLKVKSTGRIPPGSISALIALYYATPEYAELRPLSKKTYRNTLERFRIKHGAKSVARLKRVHIKAILGEMAETPAAANNLLDRLRTLMRLAVDLEWRETDPTIGLKGYKQRGTGFHTWTEEEIATFEALYPLGTRPRLAFDLLLYTNQRREDVVVLGRQHRSGNAHRITQLKTGKTLEIEILPELEASIAAARAAGIVGDLTYLVTSFGKPYTSNGFGNAMREWCDAAELFDCSAHGLRKAGDRRMAENEMTHPQIKSVSGHSQDKEVSTYTRAADQRRLMKQAIRGLRRPPR